MTRQDPLDKLGAALWTHSPTGRRLSPWYCLVLPPLWPCYPTPVTMAFPTVRPRRLRATPTLRALVRETTLTPRQFIWPLFFNAPSTRPPPSARCRASRSSR